MSSIRGVLAVQALLGCAAGTQQPALDSSPSDSAAIAAAVQEIRADSARARGRALAQAESLLTEPVRFEPGSRDLTPQAIELIDRKAWYLYFNRDLTLALAGRSDAGLDEENARLLSRGRVDAVRRRLAERGVEPTRVSVDESAPEPTGGTESTVEFQRRGELSVLDIPALGTAPPPAERVQTGIGPSREVRYRWGVVGVFYATDRRPTGKRATEDFYGPDGSENGALRFGRVEVSLPRVHRPGLVERPAWYRLELAAHPDKHMILRAVQPMDEPVFLDSLRAVVGRSGGKEAMVFIHGYNVNFHDAALRTAQLAYDLSFDGAPILYSWPSKGSLFRYAADRESAEWSAAHLADFLRSVVAVTGAKRVNVIAHSMGNMVLVRALSRLALAPARDTLFDNLVLAAPDVPLNLFQQQLAPAIRPLARRLTIYMSGRDRALWASRLLSTHLRLGEATNPVVVVRDTDTIDASSASTDALGHGYVASSKDLIDDLVLLLGQKRPPPRSTLRAMSASSGPYWRLP